MDAKSANGMMALKNLTNLKDQINNGNSINGKSSTSENDDDLLQSLSDVEKFMKLERKLRKGIPSLSRLTRLLITEETDKLWAKQDWAFVLLCIEIHE